MKHYGDLAVGATLSIAFNTEDPTGAPITLAGSPAVRAYKDASLTEVATGLTLSVDHDGRTGLHVITIDTSSDGTFYAAGSTFHIVLTVGTVNSISAVGKVLASFTLGLSAAYGRIGALGAGLTGIPWNASWDAEVQSEATDAINATLPAAKLTAHAAAVLVLVVGTGSTTTAIVFSTVDGGAPSAVDDFYNGCVIVLTSGAQAGQRVAISDYVGATTTATVSTLTGAPANAVTGIIV